MNRLYWYDFKEILGYIRYNPSQKTITLNGDFSIEELASLMTYMKAKNVMEMAEKDA